ncbi:MAG: hypothetical protein WBW33_02810 [Bryobacteraceae bacterium]
MRLFLPALLAVGAVFTWQSLTVRYSYGGNWSGLFCTGALSPPPVALAQEHIYLNPGSVGYDGQAYHYIAHDPFFQRGLSKVLDDPRLRTQRILFPLLAWLLAFGSDSRIDAALITVQLLFCGPGVYWLSRLAVLQQRSPWWGLWFLALPPVLVSIDRLLADGGLAALAVGFVFYTRTQRWAAVWLICALAALTRDTGLVLVAAMVLYCAWEGFWRRAALFLLTLAPAQAWKFFCSLHTPADPSRWLGWIPLQGLFTRFFNQHAYNNLPSPVATLCVALDYLALLGIALAIWQAIELARSHRTTPVAIAIYGYALIAVFVRNPDVWADVYGFGRTLGPLLLFLALERLAIQPQTASAERLTCLPTALVDPRILLQWGRQVLSVAKGLAGG